MNGHIPSLTNIFIFPKYFGNAKSNKEIKKKENNFIKHTKIDENLKSTIEVKEKGYTTNSKNKYNYFNKLNFDQPNKNILNKMMNSNKDNIIKKEINRIHKINKNENKQISSYNNLNKTNNIIKKLTHKNNIANNKCSSSITIKKINNQKMNIKKESLNFIPKNITSTSTSISVQQSKLNKIFQRKESQNKKGKNILNKNVPNIFIKNSILNTNNIKRPSTTFNEKNSISNITYCKEKNSLNNAKKDSGSLIFNHFANEKMKNIIKTNAKKDINISVKSKNNNIKINTINNNKKNQNNNLVQNIIIDLNNHSPMNIIKKNSTEINNNNNDKNNNKKEINININLTKKIIKRGNKNDNNNINYINSKKDPNIKSSNNLLNNNNIIIKTLKPINGIKQTTESTIINNSGINTNSISETDTNLIFKNDINNSQSDTDKEENTDKKNYLSYNNKNFDNAKKILNKSIKFEGGEKKLIIPKKINSCTKNNNYIYNKRLKKKININLVYKGFIKNNIEKYLDKESILNLSLINKKFYKKEKNSLYGNYYNKIFKDKKCEKYKNYLLQKVFTYTSKNLKNKNKSEIYEYYSKKVESNYKEEILKDIPRTFPNDIYFDKNIEKKLYNLLICYSNFNKKIGYAQGLNFVAASCLYYFKKEEDAFYFLDGFINRFELYNFLGIENKKLIQKIKYIEVLLKKYVPDLTEFLNSKLLNHEFFSTGWIITLFSNNMNKQKLLICWCFMIILGWKFFYSFTIQVLIKYKNSIINSEEKELSNKMRSILNDNQFIKDFNTIIKNTLHFMIEHITL